MSEEAKTIQEVLQSLTGAPYRIASREEDKLFLEGGKKWFVWCDDLAYTKETNHLEAAWKDAEGVIWFQTAEIVDMIRLVENLYGEEGASRMPSPPRMPPSRGIPTEVAGYPNVVRLLERYQDLVAKIARKTGTHLRLRYDGEPGVTSVRVCMSTSFDAFDAIATTEVVEQVVPILKEVYDEITNLKA